MKTIHVDTGKPYDAHTGRGILHSCGKIAATLPGKRYQRAAIITDSNVDQFYGQAVENSFTAAGLQVHRFVFPAGESSKNMATAQSILAFLADRQITRSDLVVALGGGVVGDMAGFAAAIFLRGVDYMQIPTTLLAAVDSSVGGKTAVNIPQGKNLVGAFWQPVAVVCDVDTLSTLESDVFADGMGEVIKHGCIRDRELFERLMKRDIQADLEDIISRNVQIKAEVVREDERETGLRQILNFGHTFGHGVEKFSRFTVPHGKAVAMGMYVMARAGEANGVTEPGTAERIRELLEKYQLPVLPGDSLTAICPQCLGDKKRNGDIINLILLEKIGKCRIHPVAADEFEAFIRRGESL